jgi:hypothetical protein
MEQTEDSSGDMTIKQRIDLDRKEARFEIDLWNVIEKHIPELTLMSQIYVLSKIISRLSVKKATR